MKRPAVAGLPWTVANTTSRLWFRLVHHSSVLPLFHRHDNLLSVVSQNTPMQGQMLGKKPAKHIKQSYPSINQEYEYK